MFEIHSKNGIMIYHSTNFSIETRMNVIIKILHSCRIIIN
jgi:hypothetical protein